MTDKYVSPEKLVSPREREILIILIEECAEVQHRASKLLRFGRDEKQVGQEYTNAERLSQEIGDLETIIAMAANYDLVNLSIVYRQSDKKNKKLLKYIQSPEKE